MEQKDQLLHITLMDGMVRGLLLTATHTVAEAAAIHLTSPVATAALGRTLMGTAMMGAMLKADQASVTVTIAWMCRAWKCRSNPMGNWMWDAPWDARGA